LRKPTEIAIKYNDGSTERLHLGNARKKATLSTFAQGLPAGHCALFTRLQDEGWELCENFAHLGLALAEASVLYREPLGKSCMYQIRDDKGNVVIDNDELIENYL
jgi:hypothetical protein